MKLILTAILLLSLSPLAAYTQTETKEDPADNVLIATPSKSETVNEAKTKKHHKKSKKHHAKKKHKKHKNR